MTRCCAGALCKTPNMGLGRFHCRICHWNVHAICSIEDPDAPSMETSLTCCHCVQNKERGLRRYHHPNRREAEQGLTTDDEENDDDDEVEEGTNCDTSDKTKKPASASSNKNNKRGSHQQQPTRSESPKKSSSSSSAAVAAASGHGRHQRENSMSSVLEELLADNAAVMQAIERAELAKKNKLATKPPSSSFSARQRKQQREQDQASSSRGGSKLGEDHVAKGGGNQQRLEETTSRSVTHPFDTCFPVSVSTFMRMGRSKKKGLCCQICSFEGRGSGRTRNVVICTRHRLRLCTGLADDSTSATDIIGAHGKPVTDFSWRAPQGMSCWQKAHAFYIPKGLFAEDVSPLTEEEAEGLEKGNLILNFQCLKTGCELYKRKHLALGTTGRNGNKKKRRTPEDDNQDSDPDTREEEDDM